MDLSLSWCDMHQKNTELFWCISHEAQRSKRALKTLKVHNITTVQNTGINYIPF